MTIISRKHKTYRNRQNKGATRKELERVLRDERTGASKRVLKDLHVVFKEFDIRTHWEFAQKSKS